MKQYKNFSYKEYPVPEKYRDFFVHLWEFSIKDDMKGKKWGFLPFHLPLLNVSSIKGKISVELRGSSTKKPEFPSLADTSLKIFELKPYLVAPLFGVKCCEILNFTVPVEDLTGSLIGKKKILSLLKKDFKKTISGFGELFAGLNPKPADTLVCNAVNDFIASKGRLKLGEYIPALPIGERQFQRRFKSETGMSAKDFLKNMRMASLSSELVKNDFKDSGLAFDFGYFDQPHYNKDFKNFLGCSPLVFRDLCRFFTITIRFPPLFLPYVFN